MSAFTFVIVFHLSEASNRNNQSRLFLETALHAVIRLRMRKCWVYFLSNILIKNFTEKFF